MHVRHKNTPTVTTDQHPSLLFIGSYLKIQCSHTAHLMDSPDTSLLESTIRLNSQPESNDFIPCRIKEEEMTITV